MEKGNIDNDGMIKNIGDFVKKESKLLCFIVSIISLIISSIAVAPVVNSFFLKANVKIKPILLYCSSGEKAPTKFIMQLGINSLNKNFNIKNVNIELKNEKNIIGKQDIRFLFEHEFKFQNKKLTFYKDDMLQYLDIIKSDHPRQIYCTFLVDKTRKECDFDVMIIEFEDYYSNIQKIKISYKDFNKYLDGMGDVKFPELIEKPSDI